MQKRNYQELIPNLKFQYTIKLKIFENNNKLMVLGNGMIANKFIKYESDKKKIIFASGVSNSKNTNKDDFLRELSLLDETIETNPDKSIIYFSTCSIYDRDLKKSPYILHKISLENVIKQKAKKFLIFRVSNVAGVSNNPYTILNYFIFNILQKKPFIIWKNASRNIIDIDDLYTITDELLQTNLYINQIINVANRTSYTVQYIIDQIEKHLNRKAIFTEINKGSSYDIDISAITPVIDKCKIQFTDDYLLKVLKKYYHSK